MIDVQRTKTLEFDGCVDCGINQQKKILENVLVVDHECPVLWVLSSS